MKLSPGACAVIDGTMARHPDLESCRPDITAAIQMIVGAYASDRKVLTVGNGGSSADADHIVGELMKRFARSRPLSQDVRRRIVGAEMRADLKNRMLGGLEQPLPAINLTTHTALTTAFINDADVELVYAQALLGFAEEGDVLVALSTSGNSANIVAAASLAKALGVGIVSLTGANGGRLAELADVVIRVPAEVTAEVQEYHLPVYHCICGACEAQFFD